MCGIFGSISLSAGGPLFENAVSDGTKLLSHRGPDDLSVKTFDRACFGHTRLSIIDDLGGRQPMSSYDSTVTITYNGEVYNYKELTRELKAAGHSFSTRSDTEVVMNTFRAWGRRCPAKLRGMFAFAAIDHVKGKAILARDRLGQKPIFYTVRSGTLFFSSELEPLYRVIGPFPISIEALDDCLTWQYIHAPRTIYRDVFSLPPATVLEIDLNTGQLNFEQYWSLDFREDLSLSSNEWEEQIASKLKESVSIRLMSDVPFGAFLSGGIDSSLIVANMSEIMDRPVDTFSIGFEEQKYNELEFAGEVARDIKSNHHVETVRADAFGLLPKLISHFGQPFADSSAIPTFYVSRMARKHVKMVLSGDGGDENFAGYNTYPAILSSMDTLRSQAPRAIIKRILNKANEYIRNGSVTPDQTLPDFYQGSYQHFPIAERIKLFKSGYRHFPTRLLDNRLDILNDTSMPMISRLQKMDIMSYLPGDILTKVDIASMANSLEVRSPFLDHELIELAAQMPTQEKLLKKTGAGDYGYVQKDVLRRLALQRFNPSVVDRPKWGFGIPIGTWFGGALRSKVRDAIVGSPYLNSYFERDYLTDLVDQHSAENDRSARIWNILVINEFLKTHEGAL